MTYAQTFEVEGRGKFPLDMLRYDRCYPESSEAVSRIGDRGVARTIKLRRIVNNKKEMPAEGRWKSFGWTVNVYKVVTERW